MPNSKFTRPDIVRPPSEWRSYFLPLTSGCSNNTCTFCNQWGAKLQLRDTEDIKKEIDALAAYMKTGLTTQGIPQIVYAVARQWDGQGVFLLDSDALVYPFAKLKEVLQYLNLKLPDIRRIAAYATAADILRLSVDELKELQALKLGILYIGLESGDDEVLKNICKNVTAAQSIEAVQKVKSAGILTSVTVILGIAGKAGSAKHALATARVLTAMDPDYVGALTLTLVPDTPLYHDAETGKFKLVTPFESLQELLLMVKNTECSKCFFSSVHASNYFTIRGTLPQDKPKMVKALEQIIAQGDPNALRPEYLRGL
jgi:radical SAM superfamily enzyme YgiQ (UPF0313 family)